jgi:hypothetical protein
MKKLLFLLIALLFATACIGASVEAAVPHLINYQGRVTDTSGNPLTGSYNLTFRIYDALTAGNLLWEETQTGVVVTQGLFGVMLGSVTSLSIPFDKPYYLEIKVGTEVLSPRQQITSAGYAFRAEKAEDANTVAGYSVSAAPAANKILPMSGAGKLPVAALRVYDSGWFQIANAGRYNLTHNFGLTDVTKMLVTVYLSQDAIGSQARTVSPAGGYVASTSYGIMLIDFKANQFDVQIGNAGISALDNNGTLMGNIGGDFDYCRVVAIALEG